MSRVIKWKNRAITLVSFCREDRQVEACCCAYIYVLGISWSSDCFYLVRIAADYIDCNRAWIPRISRTKTGSHSESNRSYCISRVWLHCPSSWSTSSWCDKYCTLCLTSAAVCNVLRSIPIKRTAAGRVDVKSYVVSVCQSKVCRECFSVGVGCCSPRTESSLRVKLDMFRFWHVFKALLTWDKR